MRSRRGKGIGIATIAALISLWCVPALHAEDEPKTGGAPPGSLEVVGGVEPHAVTLQACPAAPVDESEEPPNVCSDDASGGEIAGRVTLLLSSKKNASLTVGYLPDDGDSVIPLPGEVKWVFLGDGPSGPGEVQQLELEEGVLLPLSIGFVLPPDASPSAIDGDVILTAKGDEAASLSVPISGGLREFKEISVSPATLRMDSNESEAKITLSGSEVAEFLRFAGLGSGRAFTLRDDSGQATQVTVSFPPAEDIARDHPHLAKGTVRLDGDPDYGKYTGKLKLSDLLAEAPTVEVELHAHRCFLWFIVLAFLGVLFGGLATRLVAFAIRRRQLLELLKQSKAAYDHVREFSSETASWHLGDLFGELGDGTPAQDEGRLQGLAGLRTSIEAARSSKDLDEDTDRVLDMVARIQRWLRLEPAARRLAMVDKEASRVAGKAWQATKTWRDTQILLSIAQREPADVKAADDLVARLLRQAEWEHRLAAVSAGAKDRKQKKEASDTDALLGDKSTVGTRTPAEQDVLDEALLRLATAFVQSGGTLSDVPEPDEPCERAGITHVRWDASPNLFTGWATLDGPSYGQLAKGAARGARSFKPADLATETKALLLGSDAIWTLAALVLASTVYALAKYDDTWGSPADLASAFLAGVTGTIAINWAALPVFQSIRARSAEAAPAAADDAAETDEGEDKGEKDPEPAKGETKPDGEAPAKPPAGDKDKAKEEPKKG